MKRFLTIGSEVVLLVIAAVVWVRAVTDRVDAVVHGESAEAFVTIPVADTVYRSPESPTVPEPIALARWFGELPPPPPVVRRPAPAVEPEPERADYVRVTGSLVIDGHRFISAVDSRVGRALLIGENPEIADWVVVEERSDAFVVDADGERLLVVREDR